MSFDKAIEYGKEHRKQFKGSKYYERSCRNHGSDYIARRDRTYRNDKNLLKSKQKIEDLITENMNHIPRID